MSLIKVVAKIALAALCGGGAVSLTKHGADNLKNAAAKKAEITY